MTQSFISPSVSNASILQRIKESYLFWTSILDHMSKNPRYGIGNRIENKLLDLLEFAYFTYFIADRDKKNKRDK